MYADETAEIGRATLQNLVLVAQCSICIFIILMQVPRKIVMTSTWVLVTSILMDLHVCIYSI